MTIRAHRHERAHARTPDARPVDDLFASDLVCLFGLGKLVVGAQHARVAAPSNRLAVAAGPGLPVGTIHPEIF